MENILKEVEEKMKELKPTYNNELESLTSMVSNQVDNIVHGSSYKFPCATESEKINSLKSVIGFLTLINEVNRD